MTDGNQDQVPPDQEQAKPEEVANPWITDLKEKCDIRKGHHVYVEDEWNIQGLKMGL